MSKAWKTLAVMAAVSAALTGCHGGRGGNTLIGKWHIAGYTPLASMPGVDCGVTDLEFTPTTAQSFNGSVTGGKIAVTYNLAAKGEVIVSSANDVIYDIIDDNHIRAEDWFKCAYTRTG